jgi:methionyl-tRNA synthetase
VLLDNFEINKAVEYIWNEIGEIDRYIQANQPFRLVKADPEAGKKMITDLVKRVNFIASMLGIILPETSAKIRELIRENKSPETPLFLRKD